ncbi:MAG: hypothetical protein ACEY3B_04525 [Wolbachia sp.]
MTATLPSPCHPSSLLFLSSQCVTLGSRFPFFILTKSVCLLKFPGFQCQALE